MSGWVGDRCDRRGTSPLPARDGDGSRRPRGLLLGVALGLGSVIAPTVALAAPIPSGRPAPTHVAASSPAAPADVSVPRYYLVGSPRDGQPEFLYQIAARTLGDGNRYREIFDLNRGRRQPDGGELTDPLTVLRPGWILVLPPDADGPAVRVGPLPSPQVAPTRSGTTNTDDSDASAAPYLIGAVGLVAVTGLLALVLRHAGGVGRRSARDAAASQPPATGAPADTGAGPVSGAPAGATPVDEATTATLTAARPVSLLTRSGRVVVDLEGATGTGRLDVRLLGTAPDTEAGTPCAWLDDGPLPAATLPVVLGRRDGRRFFVDLAAAPDVVTITGPVSSARRVALAVTEQLHAAGVAVTVVGDALGDDAPAAYRRVSTFPTSGSDVAALTGPTVVLSAGLRGAELAAARGLAARSGHRVVPVLVGEVVRSRWSVRATEPAL